jgi:hypothetical protein
LAKVSVLMDGGWRLEDRDWGLGVGFGSENFVMNSVKACVSVKKYTLFPIVRKKERERE